MKLAGVGSNDGSTSESIGNVGSYWGENGLLMGIVSGSGRVSLSFCIGGRAELAPEWMLSLGVEWPRGMSWQMAFGDVIRVWANGRGCWLIARRVIASTT